MRPARATGGVWKNHACWVAMVESIRPPTVLAVQRRAPGRITIGDSVTLQDGPALVQHLIERVPGTNYGLGSALHGGTTVPLGLAIEAATQVCDGRRTGVKFLRYSSFSMEGRTSNRRPLRASARVAELGAKHVEVTADVWEDERLICRARFGMCCIEDGRTVPLSQHYNLDVSPDADQRDR